MANNRYIGARYVPLVVGDWNSANAYEALSVVMYQGDSYISKVPVPANIQITNTTYWAKCADYNAQWTAFQQNFTELRNEIYLKGEAFPDYSGYGDTWSKILTSETSNIIEPAVDSYLRVMLVSKTGRQFAEIDAWYDNNGNDDWIMLEQLDSEGITSPSPYSALYPVKAGQKFKILVQNGSQVQYYLIPVIGS